MSRCSHARRSSTSTSRDSPLTMPDGNEHMQFPIHHHQEGDLPFLPHVASPRLLLLCLALGYTLPVCVCVFYKPSFLHFCLFCLSFIAHRSAAWTEDRTTTRCDSIVFFIHVLSLESLDSVHSYPFLTLLFVSQSDIGALLSVRLRYLIGSPFSSSCMCLPAGGVLSFSVSISHFFVSLQLINLIVDTTTDKINIAFHTECGYLNTAHTLHLSCSRLCETPSTQQTRSHEYAASLRFRFSLILALTSLSIFCCAFSSRLSICILSFLAVHSISY